MTQPKPDSINYLDIVKNVDKGLFQIPRFQRDFVWDIKESAKLIDSLIKGFPIGTFVLWKTKERLSSLKGLGGVVFNKQPEDDSVYYILDGQQRITSLYLALKGGKVLKGKKEINYKEIYIDLSKDLDDEEEICSTEKSEHCVSFYDLMNEKFNSLLKIFGEKFIDKIENLRDHIKTYDFSIIEVKDQPFEKITDIFTRINTSGKTLTLFEIMCAKVYIEKTEREQGFDLEENFNDFVEELKWVNYESLNESKPIVLQLISLILNKDATRKAILSIEKEKFIKEWKPALECLRRAIDEIAIGYLKIPVSKFLPYPALLVPLAYFYKLNELKQPTTKQLEALSKYFFRSAFSERFNSATETKLNKDIKLIEKIQKNEDIDFEEELPIKDNKGNFCDYLKEDFSTGNAFDKAVLCIMAHNEPKNFSNSNKIVLNNAFLSINTSKNYHHFFPKAFLKRTKQEKFENALANITLIDDQTNKRTIKDKSPKEYIEKFKTENKDLEKVLESHFIKLHGFGIEDNNYETFLNKRAELLADEIVKRL